MGFLHLLSGKAWASLGLVLVLSTAIAGLYFHARDVGITACERDQLKAVAKAEKEGAVRYEAALDWGNQLSGQLVQTERKLNDTKRQYLAYANGITGNCPGSLGLLTSAASSGSSLPEASGPSADASAPVDTVPASEIAANIAENYGRCHINAAQLSALIEWHRQQDAVER